VNGTVLDDRVDVVEEERTTEGVRVAPDGDREEREVSRQVLYCTGVTNPSVSPVSTSSIAMRASVYGAAA